MKKYILLLPLILFFWNCENLSSKKDDNFQGINITVKNSRNENLKNVKVYAVFNFVTTLPKPGNIDQADSVSYGSFSYTINESKQVVLHWTTLFEASNLMFYIQRREKDSDNWITLGNVKGSGTTNITIEYSFTDQSELNGIYYYRLKQEDNGSTFFYSDEREVIIVTLPGSFELLNNTPNPFEQTTAFRFLLPERSETKLSLLGSDGSGLIETIADQTIEAGYQTIDYDATGVIPNGVYTLKMEATGLITGEEFSESVKLCKNNQSEASLVNDETAAQTDSDGNAKISYDRLFTGDQVVFVDANGNPGGTKYISNTVNLIFIKAGYVNHSEQVELNDTETTNLTVVLSEL